MNYACIGSAIAFQRYQYNVERFSNGGLIYLHRPAFKNKGCDFVVNCDPAIPRDDGRKHKNPRHDDLIGELLLVSNHTTGGRARILAAVSAVWNCEDVAGTCSSLCNDINDYAWKLRAERALKVAKWLFIEQDITDWNTSGRAMLMNGINDALVE